MNNAAPLAGFFAIRFLVITYLSPVDVLLPSFAQNISFCLDGHLYISSYFFLLCSSIASFLLLIFRFHGEIIVESFTALNFLLLLLF
jgi:hypothetical protein